MNTSNTVQTPLPVVETPKAWLTPLELCVLGAIWGASFMFMRVAAPQFGAMPLVEIRLALGAAVLLPFLWNSIQGSGRSVAHLPGMGALRPVPGSFRCDRELCPGAV